MAFLQHSLSAQPSQKQEIFVLLQAHQFRQAESIARAALAASPEDCGVELLLGLALRGEQKLEPAFASFRHVQSRCPQSLAAVEGAAETAFLLKRPEAKELLQHVIQIRPNDETSYAMLGSIEAHMGDCPGAVENYGKALSRIQQNGLALRQYARCLLLLDRAADAVTQLTQLLSLEDNSLNRRALARAQSKANDRVAALATLQPLLGEGTQDTAALVLAARLAEDANDTPHAISWLRQAIQIDSHDLEAYLHFAEISFNHASYKVGIDFMNVGLREMPNEARLYLVRGVLKVQLSQTEEALQDLQEAHRLDPKLSFAEDAMGMLFSQNHDSAAALAFFDSQSKVHPKDALLQYLYAEALSEATGQDAAQMEKALRASKLSVQLEPDYQPARDLLCTLLVRRGDYDAAVIQTEEALSKQPYDEVALYQEILAHRRLKHNGKTADLVKRLQEAKTHNQQALTRYLLEEPADSK
jgi:tetratricopeptide (TPR) repeat protein